jgi:tetratricopeptide (TPR) repeat protein
MKRMILFAIAMALVCGFSVFISCGPKPGQQPRYLEYYNQAHAYFEQNLPKKAIPLYRKVLKIQANFAQAYHEIAVCYQQVGDDSAAVSNFEGAIVFNPKDVDAYQSIGKIYFVADNLDEALNWYDKATRIDYLYPESYYNLGKIYYMRGDYSNAKKYWEMTIADDANNPRAYYGLGLVALITGDSTEAESKFLDAVKVGSMPEAVYRLGQLYFDSGKYNDAEGWINRYLEKEPEGEWANKCKDMLVIIGQKKGQK